MKLNPPQRRGTMARQFSRGLRLLAVLLSLLAPRAFATAQPLGFELAITPFLPVHTMIQNYQPMRTYLELRLQEPVTLVTAPSYKTFNERLRRHAYPFVITSANSAYLAYADFAYIPLLRPSIYTRPVLVVAKQSSVTRMQALRGTILTLPDPLAIVSMQALSMLREAGLDPQRDVTIKYLPNHSAAVNYVISGEAVAAIVSDRALMQMPEASRNAVRVVQTWEPGAAPGVVYLASPEVPRARAQRLSQAIIEFVRDTVEGREMIRKLGYGDLIPAKAEDLKPLAPYGAQLKEALGTQP
jgi:ABC-type phosphate/phosphonate transport system substrate-binding protein